MNHVNLWAVLSRAIRGLRSKLTESDPVDSGGERRVAEPREVNLSSSTTG